LLARGVGERSRGGARLRWRKAARLELLDEFQRIERRAHLVVLKSIAVPLFSSL
jgi:hypothetical protein